jgi:hypothetical protein
MTSHSGESGAIRDVKVQSMIRPDWGAQQLKTKTLHLQRL